MRWQRVVSLALVFWLGPVGVAQHAGSASLGDSLYPWMGNGGYDVQHYDIDLRLSDDLRSVQGSTVIEAIATEDVSAFNLDFGAPLVTSISVNGVTATFQHADPELTITPVNSLQRGSSFRVKVEFNGFPGSRVTALGLEETAWKVLFGELLVMTQPSRLLDWTPANDSPLDKATFNLRLTARLPASIIANGVLTEEHDNPDGTRTRSFRIDTPTTTYGLLLAVGNQKLERADPIDGVQIRHYLTPNTSSLMRQAIEQSGAMLHFFSQRLGPYPFPEFGVLTHDVSADFGLETQSLVCLYENWRGANASFENNTDTVAHELAHQWFGMLVTYKDHRDSWLHEGFATYLGWLYTQQASKTFKLTDAISSQYAAAVSGHQAVSYTKQELLDLLSDEYGPYTLLPSEVPTALELLFSGTLPAAQQALVLRQVSGSISLERLAELLKPLEFHRVTLLWAQWAKFADVAGKSVGVFEDDRFIAPGRVDSGDLVFNPGVYNRGAMAIFALRERLGETAFWALLRGFLEQFKFGNASDQDFLRFTFEHAGEIASQELQRWLYDERAPDLPSLGLYAKDYAFGADFK